MNPVQPRASHFIPHSGVPRPILSMLKERFMTVLVGRQAPDFTVAAVLGNGDIVESFNFGNCSRFQVTISNVESVPNSGEFEFMEIYSSTI